MSVYPSINGASPCHPATRTKPSTCCKPSPEIFESLGQVHGLIDVHGLAAMLSEDIELCADGGGKASAIRETLYGLEAVLAFVGESLSHYWQEYQWQEVEINGGHGVEFWV